jgi:oligoendopeptidase F
LLEKNFTTTGYFTMTSPTTSQILERIDVPTEQRWNAESVFADSAAWQAELEAVKPEIPKLGEYAGKLGSNPDTLADYWELDSKLRRRLYTLYFYAMMRNAVSGDDNEAKAMVGQAMGAFGQYSTVTAFANPELLGLSEEKLLGWVKEHKRLAIYERAVKEVFRQAQYTRSGEIEEVLGMLQEPFGGTQNSYGELSNTDLQFEPAKGKENDSFAVTQSSISMAVGHVDREIRRTGWENYMDGYLKFKNTFAAIYLTSVKQSTMYMRVRGYDSVLQMMLHPDNLPTGVFHNLIDTYKKHIPTWHRYWEVKRKALGVDKIHPYDIWAPLTTNEPQVSFEQAVNWIGEGLKPLGADYVNTLKQGCLQDRWVDYSVNKGKRQGAFSGGSYDTYPFVMMSFDNGLGGMSTLAHELGHSLHSYLSRKNQPEIYSGYTMFAAETASNFNQAMTRAYLFENQQDKDFQLALINEAMDNFHRYFFIMPTLARFEFEVHERVAAGKPLTADILNGIMSDLFAEGYGDTMSDDRERTGITWATFGHLYRPYYTFQYATGISAAHALADKVASGKPEAAQNYLSFLKSGGALNPLDALKLAGVDMTSPEAVEKTFGVLGSLVDRLEKLVS